MRGAWIDQASNVFTLGRYAIHALSARRDEEWRAGFQGNTLLAEILARATQRDRGERYPTVHAFVDALEQAAAASPPQE